jgi:hypothetical protein
MRGGQCTRPDVCSFYVCRAECFSLKGFPLVLSTIFFSQAAIDISLAGIKVLPHWRFVR